VTPPDSTTSLRRTRRGWRLSQHGTVLSEVLLQPGPTHSVFDVLAAACLIGPTAHDIALLGFGGGSVVAALRALGCSARVHAVDLDPTGRNLLHQAGASWLEPFHWHPREAVDWLRSAGQFDVIVDDLSIPRHGDVVKPDATWNILPDLFVHHLKPEGRALFNLLRPARGGWIRGVQQVCSNYKTGVVIHFDGFENRILVAGNAAINASSPLASPRNFGNHLRSGLRALVSRQQDQVRVQGVRTGSPQE